MTRKTTGMRWPMKADCPRSVRAIMGSPATQMSTGRSWNCAVRSRTRCASSCDSGPSKKSTTTRAARWSGVTSMPRSCGSPSTRARRRAMSSGVCGTSRIT